MEKKTRISKKKNPLNIRKDLLINEIQQSKLVSVSSYTGEKEAVIIRRALQSLFKTYDWDDSGNVKGEN